MRAIPGSSVRDLPSVDARARDLATTIADARARRTLDVSDLDRDFDRVSGRALRRAHELIAALGPGLDQAPAFARGSAIARAIARDLDRDFDFVRRDLDLDLGSGIALFPDLDRALALARGLARDLDRASAIAGLLTSGGSIRGRREASRVVPAAGRLAAAAARLLPAQERARYAEEFRSELWEIAHAGGRRWAQLAYAARQLVAARRLRAELRVPRRRGAAP
jgi:hypothetical protein